MAGSASVPTPVATQDLAPEGIEIPAIGVSGSLIPLGVDADGGWAVPNVETPEQASWFSEGPMPGEVGPAVILGHVDGSGRAGVFARLSEMERGDVVIVHGRGDTLTQFEVTRTDQVPKRDFPTGEVLGETSSREIRLVTCGGSFDPSEDSYRDSVIVYGTASPS